MIGVLVATHGDFGRELLKSAELIVGQQDQTLALGLHHGDGIEAFSEKVGAAINLLGKEDGVLVFVDLFGASPYNVAALNSTKIVGSTFRCVTGVSLPMILVAMTMRNSCGLDELAGQCMEAGISGIKELFTEIKLFNEKNN